MFVNTPETKARSRISTKPQAMAAQPLGDISENKRKRLHQAQKFSLSFKKPQIFEQFSMPNLSAEHVKSTPFLIISLSLYAVLFYIFTSVHPASIANWILYQSYFLVVILFLGATFFMVRFVLLKQQYAWCISIWLTLLLFLKLQSFQVSWSVIIISFLIIVAPFLIWPVLFKR